MKVTVNVLFLLLGGLLGLAIGAWERHQLKRRLQPLLTSLQDTAEVAKSLSLTSLVRRELSYLQQQCQIYQAESQAWQQLLDQAPIGFLYVDAEDHLLWCNTVAQALLQIDRWRPPQIRLLLELVRSYELDQLIQHTRHTQQPHVQEWLFFPSPISFQETKTKLSSESLLLKGHSYPLPQQKVAVFLENLQPLAEIQRQQDRIFSDLTHELRTPLTAISLVAEALHHRLQPPEQDWLKQMLEETERLRTLVDDWLSLARLGENPKQCLDYQVVDLHDILISSWQRLSPLAAEKQVHIAYDGPDQLPCEADHDRLIQVFMNLLDNCIKHSPPGSKISVQARALEEFVLQVDIVDQGEGFHPDNLPHIFERLFQGEPSRSRTQYRAGRQGSGLGLAIAKEIIIAHGGQITASNDPDTGGAHLSVCLPRQRPLDRV
ncbi:PAS domain-containing sensor histidine kinase [Synechocystis sp. LKSZ1]|uniref:sensor histidine kinase n=1 Tax=Synechocystis sp. LKSZ1 TaxID=3144951 RepID=UPI00336C2913